ncbi:MAG TPA: ABC transporter permease [Spirochaetia bacterium]|nr:ABC transporter permease [Spirochaetia bacterium]
MATQDNNSTGRGEPTSQSVTAEFSERIAAESVKNRIMQLGPLLVMVVLTVAMSIFVPGFFGFINLVSVLQQVATPLVLAMGLTFVLLLGSIDLSLEGVMGFAGSIVALLVMNSKNSMDLGVLGILIAITAGTLFGVVSGVLHTRLKIPSFMVTFGMGSAITGFGVLSYRGIPASVKDQMFARIASGTFLDLPLLTWFALVLFLITLVIERYTAFGRHLYAIGENESMVRASGINVDRIKVIVFAWSALCSSIAGVFGAIKLNIGEVIISNGFLFSTITAVVVGGTSLVGGKGGVGQSLVGVIIVVIIQDSMILLGVNSYVQPAVQGLIVVAAVALTVARSKKLIFK